MDFILYLSIMITNKAWLVQQHLGSIGRLVRMEHGRIAEDVAVGALERLPGSSPLKLLLQASPPGQQPQQQQKERGPEMFAEDDQKEETKPTGADSLASQNQDAKPQEEEEQKTGSVKADFLINYLPCVGRYN